MGAFGGHNLPSTQTKYTAMAEQSSSLIGQVLLAMGRITKKQLDEALEIQQKMTQDKRKPLGQILLELDYVDPNDIIEAIRIQVQMRGQESKN